MVQVVANMEHTRFTKASPQQQMVQQEIIYWGTSILYAIRKTDRFALLNFNCYGMMLIPIINLHRQDYISVLKASPVDDGVATER